MLLPGVWFGDIFYGQDGSCYRVDRAIRGASIADLRNGRVTDKAGFSINVVTRLRDLPAHAHGFVHGDTFTATSGRQYRLGAGHFSQHRESAFMVGQRHALTWTGRMLGVRQVEASFGAALPAGPFNTPAAAQAWLVWLFEERAARHPELAGRLKASAAVLRSRSYRATWEGYADGIREAIRTQVQPVAGNLVAGIDGFARQNGMPG
ncbi:MAG TPA: hypothetical protein PKW90_20335, partial [Myxococcota bacterium]|nr:hypothetical protein [Myxococcota bacterium]